MEATSSASRCVTERFLESIVPRCGALADETDLLGKTVPLRHREHRWADLATLPVLCEEFMY